ncbi:MAG: right-handed parallel beta-helix repeat-containing protein [Pirellulaceae bacterium]
MNRNRTKFHAVFVFALSVLVTSYASAQATRTWVSGVGDDANPGSRTAPCKTFAGAISKTAAGGEIDCLDPGGFGAVTITKAITIDGGGTFASILGAGTNGIVVNAGVNDVVTIRNLSLNGAGTGLNGIRFIAGGTLIIENCVIFNFTQKGVDFQPAGASKLIIKNTTIRNNNNAVNGGAIQIIPGVAGTATCVVDGVHMDGNRLGIQAQTGTVLSVRDAVIDNCLTNGILTIGPGLININVEDSLITNCAANGIRAGGNAVVHISNVMVMNNNTGLSIPSGQIISFGNNRIALNTTNGAPSSTIPQQ